MFHWHKTNNIAKTLAAREMAEWVRGLAEQI